jgi:S1-C subfamily serine protease
VGIGLRFVSALLLVPWLIAPVSAQSTSVGTGFLVSADGVVVTCYHVIAGKSRLSVRDQVGRFHVATLVARDVANDLALLKISGSALAHVPIMKSGDVRKGEEVFVLGFPNISMQGLETKVTQGIVSSISGVSGEPNSFQISAAVQPGNSGGPLIDRQGNVIGVVNAKLSQSAAMRVSGALPENVNYAIKSNYLIELIQSKRGIVYERGSTVAANTIRCSGRRSSGTRNCISSCGRRSKCFCGAASTAYRDAVG